MTDRCFLHPGELILNCDLVKPGVYNICKLFGHRCGAESNEPDPFAFLEEKDDSSNK